MPSRADIIKAARNCLGTKFIHQGRLPGAGLDCVGLIRWPGVSTGLYPETVDFTKYGRQPVPQRMHDLLAIHLDVIGKQEAIAGDILWLRIEDDPQHLAILTDVGTIVHAVATGPKMVVEHGFRCPWPQRVVGAFRYRGLSD